MQSFRRTSSFLVAGAMPLLIVGCATQSPVQPSLTAITMVDPALGPSLASAAGTSMGIAAQCDSDPTVTTLDVCGHSIAGDASYQWSDCTTTPPADASSDHADASILSSGTMTLETVVTGDCDLGSALIVRTMQIDVQADHGEGRTMQLNGGATATVTAPQHVSTTQLDLQLAREMSLDGSVRHTSTLDGTLSVIPDPTEGTVSLSGSLTMTITSSEERGSMNPLAPHPETGATGEIQLELHEVVRDREGGCRWPTRGEMTQTQGETVHLLSFGPACGDALLDGEAIDLSAEKLSMKRMGMGQR